MTLWAAVVVMGLVTYLLRAVPLVALRRRIENAWVRSFLFYVPYAVLTAMTIPAIFTATSSVISGVAALVVGLVFALRGKSLLVVAIGAAMAVVIVESALVIL